MRPLMSFSCLSEKQQNFAGQRNKSSSSSNSGLLCASADRKQSAEINNFNGALALNNEHTHSTLAVCRFSHERNHSINWAAAAAKPTWARQSNQLQPPESHKQPFHFSLSLSLSVCFIRLLTQSQLESGCELSIKQATRSHASKQQTNRINSPLKPHTQFTLLKS